MPNTNLTDSQKLVMESTQVPHPLIIVDALIKFIESDELQEESCTFIFGLYQHGKDSSMALIHLAIAGVPDFNLSCIGPADLVIEFGDKIREALSLNCDDSGVLKPVLH